MNDSKISELELPTAKSTLIEMLCCTAVTSGYSLRPIIKSRLYAEPARVASSELTMTPLESAETIVVSAVELSRVTLTEPQKLGETVKSVG